ncbi:MAG: hypothetical protein KA165_02745 [Saprospiraceae bacterium]|nr:hypothetical protein [Saprospiraceae bacterium]
MRKLVTKISIVLALLFAVDVLAGIALDWLRDHSPDGRYYKTKYSLESCKEDVVVIGSSRGEINYVSQVIEDSLGMSCWNAGRGGQGTPYFKAIQEGILTRYAPKVVILNVDDNDLETPPNYEHAGVLRPFYHSCAAIRPVLDKTSTFEWLLMKSRLYAYNSSFYYLIRPYFVEGLDGKTSDKGWKPRLDKMTAEFDGTLQPEPARTNLDTASVALFESIVTKLKEKGCRIFFVVSPNYGRTVSASSAIEYLKQTSAKNDIPLFIYSNDTSFITKPEYFVDPDHLNVDGARLFTQRLVEQIKPYTNTNNQHLSNDEKVFEVH